MGAQQHWSTTPGTNQTADPVINQREGMAPSQVNDAARQIMAKLKAYLLDTSGILVTAGTSTAYTLTTNEVFTSLVDGMVVACRLHTPSGANPTLNVDGLGAVPITVAPATAPPAGTLVASVPTMLTFVSGEWRASGLGHGVLQAPVGTRMAFQQTAAPLGWVKEANALYDNAALRLVTGAAGTGGSANFTDVFTGRLILQANLPNVSFVGSADLQGSHNHGGATSVAGDHSHTPAIGGSFEVETGGGGSGTAGGTGRQLTGSTSTNGAHSHLISSDGAHTHGVSVSSGGIGDPVNFAVKFADFIVAQKA